MLVTSIFPQCLQKHSFLRWGKPEIFSSAVFGENQRYCYSLGIVVTFCNISVITEDIYLKLESMWSLSKQQFILSRVTIQNSFSSKLCPFFDLDFLSSIKQPTAEHWHLYAVFLFCKALRLQVYLDKGYQFNPCPSD